MKAPRTTAAATAMIERWAEADAAIAEIEAARTAAIGRANAEADALLAPRVAERDALAAAIEPWWFANRASLVPGVRKSAELAGCVIGSKISRAALLQPEDEDATLAAMKATRWAVPYLRVRYAIDRNATLKGLDGRHGEQLRALGFARVDGEDRFFIERTAQAGTIAG